MLWRLVLSRNNILNKIFITQQKKGKFFEKYIYEGKHPNFITYIINKTLMYRWMYINNLFAASAN